MNQRLVWNFEINSDNLLAIPETLPAEEHTDRWESRFFWPEGKPILLSGLDESFLALSRYQVKHRQDTYCVLPESDYNIKIRRNQLLYKPCMMKTANAIAYGKKINVEETDDKAFIMRIQREGLRIEVDKEALIYRFETVPTLKLELARLRVANTTWFSVNIESRSRFLVECIVEQVLNNHVSCDYVTFLKALK